MQRVNRSGAPGKKKWQSGILHLQGVLLYLGNKLGLLCPQRLVLLPMDAWRQWRCWQMLWRASISKACSLVERVFTRDNGLSRWRINLSFYGCKEKRFLRDAASSYSCSLFVRRKLYVQRLGDRRRYRLHSRLIWHISLYNQNHRRDRIQKNNGSSFRLTHDPLVLPKKHGFSLFDLHLLDNSNRLWPLVHPSNLRIFLIMPFYPTHTLVYNVLIAFSKVCQRWEYK